MLPIHSPRAGEVAIWLYCNTISRNRSTLATCYSLSSTLGAAVCGDNVSVCHAMQCGQGANPLRAGRHSLVGRARVPKGPGVSPWWAGRQSRCLCDEACSDWQSANEGLETHRRLSTGMEPDWSQTGARLEPEWSQNEARMEPEWNQNRTRMEAEWKQNRTRRELERSQNGTRREPEWSLNGAKMEQEWN